MKYGVHAAENVNHIIQRKKNEIMVCGEMFWGYGGTICHPFKQVQPFINQNLENGEDTYLFLSRTNSDFEGNNNSATVMSTNGFEWEILPRGVHIYSSKYALVCNSLEAVDREIDLSEYVVGVGNSTGKQLSEYVRGRVDKGCGRLIANTGQLSKQTSKEYNIRITYIAKVINAVMVK